MIQVNILEQADIIKETDFVRQLVISENEDGVVEHNSMYSGLPTNRSRWLTANVVCPAFIGKTVGVFNEVMARFYRLEVSHEFIRGNIPESHVVKLTKSEEKIVSFINDNR